MMERLVNKRKASDLANAPRLLDRKVKVAQFMLMFERVWRALLWPFSVTGSFLLISLAELWRLLPALAHSAGLIGFAVAFLASLVPLARVAWTCYYHFVPAANFLWALMRGLRYSPLLRVLGRNYTQPEIKRVNHAATIETWSHHEWPVGAFYKQCVRARTRGSCENDQRKEPVTDCSGAR